MNDLPDAVSFGKVSYLQMIPNAFKDTSLWYTKLNWEKTRITNVYKYVLISVSDVSCESG